MNKLTFSLFHKLLADKIRSGNVMLMYSISGIFNHEILFERLENNIKFIESIEFYEDGNRIVIIKVNNYACNDD